MLKDTPGRRQSKTPILLRNVDKKTLETVFLIAICRPSGDKWQSKSLFLSIFDPRSSIVDNIFDCRLSEVEELVVMFQTTEKQRTIIAKKHCLLLF